ncbi:biotin--[acetyl-CoA-carboxylase] ligase [Treponema porcinum]|uniref:biotin--[acetyl-CoA-carboxylase] ligase n=1 Tax=Treponema porcinum TaxID=261392 RepID=UPI0023579A3B|nr:biotin--[acetyl-CoA-carboxylase] ligase [Treponema porcinum]MCI6721565.1 biotin--[acetyl-CoA-carboxylase] ligase [Treponema porcinum]
MKNLCIPGVRLEYFDIIDSTNSEAKRRLGAVPPEEYRLFHKTVLVAGEQTAGRGRLGRKFYSPGGTGLYFSLVYAAGSVSDPGKITAVAAVAVCRAIKSVFNVDAGIKWVNDIFVSGKKVCGILTEGIVNPLSGAVEAAVIGIGINIYFSSKMPEELSLRAGGICGSSLSGAGDENADGGKNAEMKDRLLCRIIENLVEILDGREEEFFSAMEEYKARSTLIGKTVTVSPVIDSRERQYDAVVTGITDDAQLVVRTSDGREKTLSSGEVTLHANS